eukprot:TRINITY_DN27252_c0_g1_i4.p1 TRINITY_DN27252_c0_g1~~TRINITY_DN27252_c0_g1_i4.p1  ORF type:complete len:240 (+),score=52.78 TRINITY_DN27252_c0_g1_i4:22-720(+)
MCIRDSERVRHFVSSEQNSLVPEQLQSGEVSNSVILTLDCDRGSVWDLCVLLDDHLLGAFRHDEQVLSLGSVHEHWSDMRELASSPYSALIPQRRVRGARQLAHVRPVLMNRPERQDLLIVPEGSKKVVVQKDTKIPNAATITVEREDHTIGNLARLQLLRNKRVLFAGYKVPHPLEYKVQIRVQTTPDTTPTTVTSQALMELVSELGWFENKFQEQVQKKKNPSADQYIMN